MRGGPLQGAAHWQRHPPALLCLCLPPQRRAHQRRAQPQPPAAAAAALAAASPEQRVAHKEARGAGAGAKSAGSSKSPRAALRCGAGLLPPHWVLCARLLLDFPVTPLAPKVALATRAASAAP